MSDLESEAKLTLLNEDLHERLEARHRAISNWKRLKIVIVILKMCNGRFDEAVMSLEKDEVEKKTPTFDDWFTKFVISPFSTRLIIWNLFMTLVYLLSIFQDTLTLGFHLDPLLDPWVSISQSALSALMIIDIVVKFFVAFPQTQ